MTLNMYAFIAYTAELDAVDFMEPAEIEHLHYWRNHLELHAWMQRLYHAKGGRKRRCLDANLALSVSDLAQLEADIMNSNLSNTKGRLFKRFHRWPSQDDLAFIRRARTALDEGQKVYYTTL